MAKKNRIEIPNDIAAKILFLSDRTCCVCRSARKPVQIHHIDEDPANNSIDNLAVLCLDCHNDTMIRGGFGRRLNAAQVILYRGDWLRIIEDRRASTDLENLQKHAMSENSNFIEYVTSVGEIYREREQFVFLVDLYHSIGNYELRDKYIEIALKKNSSNEIICYLRGLQGRPDLIPKEVIEREIARYTEEGNYSQRAKFYSNLGMEVAAVKDYVQSILINLEDDKVFTAAYYLKELVDENLIDKLFEAVLKRANEENNLWLQIRALQELGWESELNDLLFRNAQSIEQSGNTIVNEVSRDTIVNTTMKILLAKARGDKEEYLELRKELARSARLQWVGIEDNDPVQNDGAD